MQTNTLSGVNMFDFGSSITKELKVKKFVLVFYMYIIYFNLT
jgi:hypothetical protein